MRLRQVNIERLAINLVLLVKDSRDQDRERECAEKDEEDSTSYKNHRVWLTKILGFLDEQVCIIFDLFVFQVT